MAARKQHMSERNVMNLIREIKRRPCLWNTDDVYYNERAHIATAWEEICATLKLPEDFLRAKWKNLRDLFKREMRKFDVKSIEAYNGKWRNFKYLWFLHKPGDQVEYSDDASDTYKEENPDQPARPDPHEFEAYIINNIEKKRLASETEDQDPFLEKRMRYNDDEYDMMFLKSLTPYFRDLESWRKLVVRNKIQDIILSELAAQNNYQMMHE